MSDVLRRRRRVACLALALLSFTGTLAASAVPDPTRPAIAMRAEASPDNASLPPAMVLQSTLVSPRQRSAIIDGQRFRAGDRIGDARIEAIGPGWVRLATPTGRTELRLSFPSLTRPVNR